MIDPITAANVAIEAVGLCVKVVKVIKRALETMKQTREGLLELVNRTERMRTILDLVRVLCTELKGTPQEGQEFIPLDRDQCLHTMRDLETLANKIAGVWAKNKALAGVQWLWYKNKTEELVERLHKQEDDIVNLLTIIGVTSSLKTSKEVNQLKEAAVRDSTMVDAFDGLTLVDETLQANQSATDQFESLPTWLGHVVIVNREQGPIVSEHYISHRHQLSEAAFWGRWSALWTELQVGREEYDESWINAIRLKPQSQSSAMSFWTPLHQAVYNKASLEVVEKMLHSGAFRRYLNSPATECHTNWSGTGTLRTRWTQFSNLDMTPLELAQDLGYSELYSVLSPVLRWPVPAATLSILQRGFHEIIYADLGDRVESEQMYLPELVVLTELVIPQMWFPIKGTKISPAGYVYRLDGRELIVKSYNVKETDGTGRSHTYRLTEEEAHEIDEALIFGD